MRKPASQHRRRSQADRVRETRETLFEAVLDCLDQKGYADTTIAAVQDMSGLSRGALMYHFATRQEMIVATAKRLLEAAIRPTRRLSTARAMAGGNVADLLMFYWRHIVNTREGRAFIEILVACRTDAALDLALAPHFAEWDAEIGKAAQESFRAVSGLEDDAAMLWSMARAFLRGLVIHARFVDDPMRLEGMVRRFGMMMAEELSLRGRM